MHHIIKRLCSNKHQVLIPIRIGTRLHLIWSCPQLLVRTNTHPDHLQHQRTTMPIFKYHNISSFKSSMLIAVVPIITITTNINMIKDLRTCMLFTRNACFAWELNPTALSNLENRLAQKYHKRVHTVQIYFLLQILNYEIIMGEGVTGSGEGTKSWASMTFTRKYQSLGDK